MVVVVALVMLLMLGGIHYYLAHRIWRGLAALWPRTRLWPILCVLAVLTLVTVLSVARLPLPRAVGDVIETVGAYWLGIFIYLLIFTVAADVVALVCRWMHASFVGHPAFRWGSVGAVLLLTLVTVIYGACHARQIKQVNYEITLENKADVSDIHIVMISDLHLGAVGSESRLADIVDAINAQGPDLVCIAGDFFDTDFGAIKEPDRAAEQLRRIRATYGVYACLGNHDAGSTYADMEAFLEQSNIRLLKDDFVVIDERLVLVGRRDGSPIGSYDDEKRQELSSFFERPADDLAVIVMDHNPIHVSEYADEADLVLCGHTHKGQIFPGGLITGAMYTVDHGYYRADADSPQVIVTSGIGTWGLPMRVGTDSELVTIRLLPETE